MRVSGIFVIFFQKFCRLEKFIYLCSRIKHIKMKQKKRELMMQELGKYCLDMSKLIFGGVILAGIMNLGVDNIYLFGVGGVLVAFFAAIGFNFYAKSR